MTDRDDPLEAIIEILKEPADLSPDLTDRVMSEIDRLSPPGVVAGPGLGPWWRRRWTIRLSPLGGLGLAAGLGLLLLAAQLAGRRTNPAASPIAVVSAAGRLTQFVLIAPDARAVTVVGDFNDWSMSATPLERAEGDGVWYVTVPLTPGRYRYAFVVNGTIWRNDPEAPAAEDEFGRPNSVVTVEERDRAL
ncbi:MAG TPA: isoamylase early set domain-containing protein [Gemmatimonadales bacterium]